MINKESLCIIPARGGSKRIPRKNIKLFKGKPMLNWAIEIAINSNLFKDIIVSTDDNEIANIALEAGVEVPFIRPKELSDDITTTVPVISHGISEMKKIGKNYKFVCCIYPCNPFLLSEDLKATFTILTKGNHHFVYPITEYKHPIQRALKRLPNGKVQFIEPSSELKRTQDLEKRYHDSGSFYWGKESSWLSKMKMHTDGVTYVIPSWRTVDIDNESDWIRAEIISELIAKSN